MVPIFTPNKSFQKDDDYQCLVIHSHGYAEYSSRYFEFAAENEVLNGSVKACACLIDHFGHGNSDGLPGYIDSLFLVAEDLAEYAKEMKKKYAKNDKMKMFLNGNSMGGCISILVLRKYPSLFDGAILQGPLIIPTNPPNILIIWSAHVLNFLMPTYALLDVLQQLNTDPAVEKVRKSDPEMYMDKMRIGTGLALQTAFLENEQHLDEIKTPFCIYHGELDTACSVSGSKLLLEKAQSKDKKLVIYPKTHHELPWEPCKDKFISELQQWIQEHK